MCSGATTFVPRDMTGWRLYWPLPGFMRELFLGSPEQAKKNAPFEERFFVHFSYLTFQLYRDY